jgi:trk system potassium uptake protein TrkH
MTVDERVTSLAYAVRGRVITKYLGQLSLALAAVGLVPLAVALGFRDGDFALRCGGTVVLLAAFGAPFASRRASPRLQTNEAMTVIGLAFVLGALGGSLSLLQPDLPFVDALFEGVSGITTTGLTTLPSVSDRSPSFLFARAWMQWYGGLGMVILSLALLSGPASVAPRLARLEAEGGEDLVAGTRHHARRVLQVYVVLTAAGVLMLWALGIDPYPALLHALAGVSTGGFSPFDNSMADLGPWPAQAALMLLCFAGAVSLALYHPAYYTGWRGLAGHAEVRALVACALLTVVLLGLSMCFVGHFTVPEVVRNAPLVGVSAQTGAGFSSTSVAALDPASKLILIVSMLIGGGVGSTAGGIKILRLLILLRLFQLAIQRTRMPRHAVVELRVGGHRMEPREVEHALLIIVLFVMVVVLSWLPFLALGYPALDSLFEVVSAIATVGLSTGLTGPQLPDVLKGVLCVDMLLGRLEVVALLLVLYPGTWVGKRMD